MINFLKLPELKNVEAVAKSHYDSLNNEKTFQALNALRKDASQRRQDFLNYLIKNHKRIVTSKPIDLLDIVGHINSKKWDEELSSNKKFKEGVLEAYGYANRFRKIQSRGINLGQSLGVKSCPYCNSQYTLTVFSKSDGTGRLLYHFDHYFPKLIYPYFSASFFNLIPCCASCNSIKSDSVISDLSQYYHPYFNNLAAKSLFRVNFKENQDINTIISLDTEDTFDIEFIPIVEEFENFVQNHERKFHINAIYSQHKDEVSEMLLKVRKNRDSYRKGIEAISGLFMDKHDVDRFILGAYTREQDFLRRPLSKMKTDIGIQLKLI
jgi:hypothetical protein